MYVHLINERTKVNSKKQSKVGAVSVPKKNYNIKTNTVGLLQLFVLASIAYSTYIVYLGTTGYAPKVMLIPQALWAGILAIQKFTK